MSLLSCCFTSTEARWPVRDGQCCHTHRCICSRPTRFHCKLHCAATKVQELCESRDGRPGLSVLMNLTVSVDVKQH